MDILLWKITQTTVFHAVLVFQASKTKTPCAERRYYLVTWLLSKCWVSYYTTLTFLEQKVLGLLPCLQGVWLCTAPQGAKGTAVLCVSSAGAGPVWPTWWVLYVKVTAAAPDFLALPPLLWQVWVRATTALSWWMPRSGFGFLSLLLHPPATKPNHNPIRTACLTCPCPFLPASAPSVSPLLPSHPFSLCSTKKTSDKLLAAHLSYPVLHPFFIFWFGSVRFSSVRFGL